MKKIQILIGALLILSTTGCNDHPAIQSDYEFSLSSWYLQKSIAVGEEVEIRFYLHRQGDYKDASYRIGYIQLDGTGRVYDMNRSILSNREEYDLATLPELDKSDPEKWVFTLYYRSTGLKKNDLRFFVIDNFKNQREYDVSFSTDNSGE